MNKIYNLLFFVFIHALYSQESQTLNSEKGFIENKGQIIDQYKKINNDVLYTLNTSGLNVQLRKTGFSYDFYEVSKKPSSTKNTNASNFIGDNEPEDNSEFKYKIHRIDFDFKNTNPNITVVGLNKSKDYDNYYNLPYISNGITYVYKYQEIIYKDIYNKIDLIFAIPEDPEKPVEYNFVINEGGNIDDIQFTISGAKTQLEDSSIKMLLRFGELKESIPLSWAQNSNGGKSPVKINYRKIKKNLYGFETTDLLPDTKIIIDPVPVRLWGTYFGGTSSAGPSQIMSDSNNDVYLVGSTGSINNIATAGTHQSTFINHGYSNGFIVKFNPDGVRIWGTYYPVGGRNVAIDSDFNIIFGGSTIREGVVNLTSAGSYQPEKNRYTDTYLVKLNSSGIRLWGTYYGGEGNDSQYAIDTDVNNNIYFVGQTDSRESITSTGSFQESFTDVRGQSEAILIKFSPDGNRLWATYYGGSKPDGFSNVQISDDNFIYVSGSTSSTDLATPNAYQIASNGNSDGLIVKFSSEGLRIWATYLGGSANDSMSRGYLKGNNYYIQGGTSSATDITTPNTLYPDYRGLDITHRFIINFDVATQQKIWGTYFFSQITDIVVNQNNEVLFCGDTSLDSGIATPDAYMPVKGTYHKSYLVKLNNFGQRIWGTYYGGDRGEQICYTTVNTLGDIYMFGVTIGSTTGIATPGAYQMTIRDSQQSTYVVKFRDCSSFSTISSNSPVCAGTNIELHAQGGTSFLWSGPNNFSSTLQDPVIPGASVLNAGLYSCYITGSTGCDATVDVQINVGDTVAPVPNVTNLPILTATCAIAITSIPTANDNCMGAVNATTTNSLNYEIAGTYIVNWQYVDGNGNIATQQQTVIVSPGSGSNVNPDVTFEQCENSGNVFNLPAINSQITNDTGAVIVFYADYNDALLQRNAIINPGAHTIQHDNEVFAVVLLSGGCKEIAVVHLIINPNPVTQFTVINKCFSTGAQLFNLGEAQSIIDPSMQLTLTYYASLNDLANNILITTTTAYNTQLDAETIYVKSTNSLGCYSISELQLRASQITHLQLNDHNECADPDGNAIHYDLSQNHSMLLAMIPADTYQFKYYDNYNDAFNGSLNNIDNDYSFTSGNRNIFYRVTGNSGCPYIIEIKLNIIEKTDFILNPEYSLCEGNSLPVSVNNEFNFYNWSTGSASNNTTIYQPGDYYLTVGKTTNGITCYTTKYFTVSQSSLPNIQRIAISDFTNHDNTITIYPANELYKYSLDGINFQDSNSFTNLDSGIYNVYVKDDGNCGTDHKKIVLLMYPKYFTPNEDGENDLWHIKNSYFDDRMTIYIYDRYAKLLTTLNKSDRGWDGTFNGQKMPASDYWFVIKRQSEIEIKGHFSLVR